MARFPQRSQDPRRWRRGAPIGRQQRTAWDDQADWYDRRQGQHGDDFHRDLVLPAVLRQLACRGGERVLDVGCGTGLLGRHLAPLGIDVLGIDASPAMVERATERAGPHETYRVGDAHDLVTATDGVRFDHAACVLVLQDLDPLDHALAGMAACVTPGGRLVAVITHPAFRMPRRHQWGWDENQQVMYRRLDGYLTAQEFGIRTHPGRDADDSSSRSFHRPLSAYLNALGAAGWAVLASEELCSHRRGSRGRRSAAEDRAHREIPVFLVLTALRLPELSTGSGWPYAARGAGRSKGRPPDG